MGYSRHARDICENGFICDALDDLIMKFYDYLYFGFYRLLSKTTTDKDIAEYSALIFFSIGIGLNFMSALRFCGVNPTDFMPIKVYGLTLYALLLVLNYLYFVRKDYFLILAERYKPTTWREANVLTAVTIFFIIESIALPIVVSLNL